MKSHGAALLLTSLLLSTAVLAYNPFHDSRPRGRSLVAAPGLSNLGKARYQMMAADRFLAGWYHPCGSGLLKNMARGLIHSENLLIGGGQGTVTGLRKLNTLGTILRNCSAIPNTPLRVKGALRNARIYISQAAPPQMAPPLMLTGNPMDDCWNSYGDWATNRQQLANCAVGYGGVTRGGHGGRFYVVNTTDDDPVDPPPGSLRYGITRNEPLWIVFLPDMDFRFNLPVELVPNSHKTIDGRGARVFFSNLCFVVHNARNVILHGLNFYRCTRRDGMQAIRTTETTVEMFPSAPGDAICVNESSHVWIDHCSFDGSGYGEEDKHIVVKHHSSLVTISNSKFKNQDKAILLGHDDLFTSDVRLRVTVMLNLFGENLIQRMPRCRFGHFHVLNNYYPFGWRDYAIGGSANPTILSEGNYYVAGPINRQVTGRQGQDKLHMPLWNWKSRGDAFFNGAYFFESGRQPPLVPPYPYTPIPASMVPGATAMAGPMTCVAGQPCQEGLA